MRQPPQGLYRDVRTPLAGRDLCGTQAVGFFFSLITIYNQDSRRFYAEAENNKHDRRPF